MAAWLLRPALMEIRQRVDSSEYGGMPLIGVNGTCIIAHGSSTPKAIKNAIHMAKRLAEEQVTERIQEDLERNNDILDVDGTRRGKLWRQIRNHMPFRGEYEFDDDPPEPQDELPSSHMPLL